MPKTIKKVDIGDHVRLKSYTKTSINAYAAVRNIERSRIYLSNFNMPFLGTISRWFSREEFEKETGKTF